MKFKKNIENVIERHKDLWDRRELEPPLIYTTFPEGEISTHGHFCELSNNPEEFYYKFKKSLEIRKEIPDDSIPMLVPPFSHAILPAILGAEIKFRSGKFFAKPCMNSIDEYESLYFSIKNKWYRKIESYYSRLLRLANSLFPIGIYELPAPADLMGALRGFDRLLMDLYDYPDKVHKFADKCVKLAVEMNECIHKLISSQENFGGTWVTNSWAPGKCIFFSEHSSVNFSPELYLKYLEKPNEDLVNKYSSAVSYVYPEEGKHLLNYYLNRECPLWIWSASVRGYGNIEKDIIDKYPGSIVTIRSNPGDFNTIVKKYGSKGIAYMILCKSFKDSRNFLKSIGLE